MWPDNGDLDDKTIFINVTVLLAKSVYMSDTKTTLSGQDMNLIGDYNRSAPAILAGLQEGVRYGLQCQSRMYYCKLYKRFG